MDGRVLRLWAYRAAGRRPIRGGQHPQRLCAGQYDIQPCPVASSLAASHELLDRKTASEGRLSSHAWHPVCGAHLLLTVSLHHSLHDPLVANVAETPQRKATRSRVFVAKSMTHHSFGIAARVVSGAADRGVRPVVLDAREALGLRTRRHGAGLSGEIYFSLV